jgi:hypothetical protein
VSGPFSKGPDKKSPKVPLKKDGVQTSSPFAKQLSERAGSWRCLRVGESQANLRFAPKSDSIANKFNAQNKMGEHELSHFRFQELPLWGKFLKGCGETSFKKFPHKKTLKNFPHKKRGHANNFSFRQTTL